MLSFYVINISYQIVLLLKSFQNLTADFYLKFFLKKEVSTDRKSKLKTAAEYSCSK